MDTSMAEMRAVSAAVLVGGILAAGNGSVPALATDFGMQRSREEFTSARVVHNGPDRRVQERPQHDEVAPLLSVVYEVGGVKFWNLRDSRTSHEITGCTADEKEFAMRWLGTRGERIMATQSFYDWNQA